MGRPKPLASTTLPPMQATLSCPFLPSKEPEEAAAEGQAADSRASTLGFQRSFKTDSQASTPGFDQFTMLHFKPSKGIVNLSMDEESLVMLQRAQGRLRLEELKREDLQQKLRIMTE